MAQSGATLHTDRVRLTTEAYANSNRLGERIALYDYEREPMDFVGWVVSRVTVVPDARVLDVGCGPGRYLAHLLARHPDVIAVGCDLSIGMAAEADAAVVPAGIAVADAQTLPFADDAFDVALAPHMLYHVPDIAQAGRELARVTRADGSIVIVTNAMDHLAEITELALAAIADVCGPDQVLHPRSFERFPLERAAELLGDALAVVATEHCIGLIDVPTSAPVVRYIDSMREIYVPPVPPEAWSEVLEAVAQRVERQIATTGAFTTRDRKS
ncbi:MAG: bioC2, partial [Actinomycetia bacterium]|nr:bioC2 [Actinomycetes bacterium]